MSEDTSSANDGADIWRDPSGIITLGESGHERHTTGHKIIVLCDSHTSPIRRLIIRRSAPGETTRRGTCPSCGRMATIKIIAPGSP